MTTKKDIFEIYANEEYKDDPAIYVNNNGKAVIFSKFFIVDK